MDSVSTRCPSCTDPGTKACGGCHNVTYCSLSCQQADWQFHKTLCKTIKEFETRPSPEMRRVVCFRHDQKKAQFMWLPVTRHPGYQSVDYEDIMGQNHASSIFFHTNNITGAALDLQIKLFYDDSFMAKYSQDNEAVVRATNFKVQYAWRGPLVAVCGYGSSTGEMRIVEAFGDFCRYHSVHYFQWEGEQRELNDPSRISERRQIVLDQMTPENWQTYFMQWQSKKYWSTVDLAEGVERMGLDKRAETS